MTTTPWRINLGALWKAIFNFKQVLQWHLHPYKCVTHDLCMRRNRLPSPQWASVQMKHKFKDIYLSIWVITGFHMYFPIIASIFSFISAGNRLVLHSFIFCWLSSFALWAERTEIMQTQLWYRFLKWRANRWWQPRKQLGETLGYHGITDNSRKSCVNMDFQMTKDCCERFCCESK